MQGFVIAFLLVTSPYWSFKTNQILEPVIEEDVVVFEDPTCRTEYLPPAEVEKIIRETQTMNLNFVALAKAESGLNNTSKLYSYRGIFHIHEGFHKLNDYCSPAEQVKWLERKLSEGAPPEKLFPGAYRKLYEN